MNDIETNAPSARARHPAKIHENRAHTRSFFLHDNDLQDHDLPLFYPPEEFREESSTH
jgi:hypothetical protein